MHRWRCIVFIYLVWSTSGMNYCCVTCNNSFTIYHFILKLYIWGFLLTDIHQAHNCAFIYHCSFFCGWYQHSITFILVPSHCYVLLSTVDLKMSNLALHSLDKCEWPAQYGHNLMNRNCLYVPVTALIQIITLPERITCVRKELSGLWPSPKLCQAVRVNTYKTHKYRNKMH